MGSINDKNRGRKSRDTAPLTLVTRIVVFVIFVHYKKCRTFNKIFETKTLQALSL